MAATIMTHARHSAGSTFAGFIGSLSDALHAAFEAHTRSRAVRELRSLTTGC